MKVLITLYIVLNLLLSCKQEGRPVSSESISDTTEQGVLFQKVTSLFSDLIPDLNINDSISILLLPIQRTCPACRKKIVDSIAMKGESLGKTHFIIISANGGRKTIDAFFRERGLSLPVKATNIFIDSTDQGYKKNLYKDKPVIFYGFQRKVYKKVSSLPITVADDLREYFSGVRSEK